MKDEEMADKHSEEYVMREDVITENDRVPFDNGYGFQTVDFEKEVKKGYNDGFLAGLKAGRPQWHYMKDVNCYEDLPHNEDVYYAYVVNVGAYDKPTIECRLGIFAEIEFDVMAYHVIAWCEIPTFDKE